MIGQVIRARRKKEKMTLDDLAKAVGITPGGLSQIERGIVDPSLSVLKRLAKALNMSMYQMFTAGSASYVSRSNERVKAVFPDMNIDYEFLTPQPGIDGTNPKMEVVMVTLRPQSWGYEKITSHEADECFIVVKGSIEVHMQDEVVLLHELDSIYLPEGLEHRLYNPTGSDAAGFSVMSSVTY